MLMPPDNKVKKVRDEARRDVVGGAMFGPEQKREKEDDSWKHIGRTQI